MKRRTVLVSLLLTGCAGKGAEGIPIPPPMDMTALKRPDSPNTALAAPAGFQPAPDIVTPQYKTTPAALYAAIQKIALAQPRTYAHVAYDDRLQAHFVARSRWFNFPDLIAVQVTPESGLILWSRSIYGYGDMGVNRARLTTWLAALDATLATT